MKNKQPKIDIIILNRDGWTDTRECIKSLKESDYPCFSIILVDNGSDECKIDEFLDWGKTLFTEIDVCQKKELDKIDGYEKFVKKIEAPHSKNLIVIKNKKNLGFAAANNIGIRLSQKSGSDYVFLLNNDTVAEKSTLKNLVGFIHNNREFSIAVPQIRYYKPSNLIWNCGGKLTFFGKKKYYFRNKNCKTVSSKSHKRITFVTGCAIIFNPVNTGMLSEKFFYGEEDYEFSLRMKRNKIKMACVYNSVIYHKGGRSINKLYRNDLNKINLHYLNRFINLKDYYSKVYWNITVILNIIYIIISRLFKFEDNPGKIYSLIRNLLRDTKEIDKVDENTFELIRNRRYS